MLQLWIGHDRLHEILKFPVRHGCLLGRLAYRGCAWDLAGCLRSLYDLSSPTIVQDLGGSIDGCQSRDFDGSRRSCGVPEARLEASRDGLIIERLGVDGRQQRPQTASNARWTRGGTRLISPARPSVPTPGATGKESSYRAGLRPRETLGAHWCRHRSGPARARIGKARCHAPR